MDRLARFEEGLQNIESLLHSFKDSSSPADATLLNLVQGMFNLLKDQFMVELGTIRQELQEQDEKIDRLETYSRRHCILVHGIPEAQAKTEQECMEVTCTLFNQKLGLQISPQQLDRAHRLGPPRTNAQSSRPRPVIVKLHSYLDKREIFQNKKKLRPASGTAAASGISITESLTKPRLQLLNEARDHFGRDKVWTNDGKILIKTDDTRTSKLITITNRRELGVAKAGFPRNTGQIQVTRGPRPL
uniref:Uncharacterized protein n=1 Tax=Cacopsylla melanoneura TaxID=428564 RepID=A0A8D8X3E9_9HEMI